VGAGTGLGELGMGKETGSSLTLFFGSEGLNTAALSSEEISSSILSSQVGDGLPFCLHHVQGHAFSQVSMMLHNDNGTIFQRKVCHQLNYACFNRWFHVARHVVRVTRG
jgi:hypothetical protein